MPLHCSVEILILLPNVDRLCSIKAASSTHSPFPHYWPFILQGYFIFRHLYCVLNGSIAVKSQGIMELLFDNQLQDGIEQMNELAGTNELYNI